MEVVALPTVVVTVAVAPKRVADIISVFSIATIIENLGRHTYRSRE